MSNLAIPGRIGVEFQHQAADMLHPSQVTVPTPQGPKIFAFGGISIRLHLGAMILSGRSITTREALTLADELLAADASDRVAYHEAQQQEAEANKPSPIALGR